MRNGSLGKVIDYFEYFKAANKSSVTSKTLAMVEQLYPKIEALLDDELSRLAFDKDVYAAVKSNDELKSCLDFTVVVSLSFIVARYLKKLSSKPNSFFITDDTVDAFITNLIRGMLNIEREN